MSKKFTYKKHPRPTGLAGIGSGERHDVKLNKKIVGSISGGGWRDPKKYRGLIFTTTKGNVFTKSQNSVEEVKEVLQKNFETFEKYGFKFPFEEE